MAKFTFKHRVEWSDWSEHSPSHTGQLPCAVVLPDGERVELDEGSRIFAAHYDYQYQRPGSRATYVRAHPRVRFREEHWGDDGSRRVGRAGSELEVLAPRGSTFLFARVCPWCGEKAGEEELIGKHSWEKAEPLYHEICEARAADEQKTIEEHRRYVEEQERIEQEAWEQALDG